MYEYNENRNAIEQSAVSQAAAREQEKARRKAEQKASRKRFWAKVGTGIAVGLAFGVVAGCSYSAVTRAIDHFFPKAVEQKIQEAEEKVDKTYAEEEKHIDEPIKEEKSLNIANDNDQRYEVSNVIVGMDVSQIVDNSMPSIVSITNKSVQEIMSMWGMGVQQYESKSAGSGIIIGQNDEELLIVTNNHVVSKADTLTVGFVDEEIYSAYVKGTDSDMDLAVIGVKLSDLSQETKDAIDVAVIGDSDTLKVGEQVVAIGNALGYGQSVTTGIVSALERDVTDDNVDNPLIQTDAAINPGNSGGALFDMNGELVGINSAKIASTAIEGVGYAIPMKSAMPIIESLMNREVREVVDAAEAGYIGISGVSVDYNTSEAYGIPQGVYIQTVEEDSPADKAGIIKSDVIKKFDGITVSSISDIREKLDYYKAGETVDLTVYRLIDGEYVEKIVPITLGNREGTVLDPNNKQENPSDNQVDEDKNKGFDDSTGKDNEPSGDIGQNGKTYEFNFNGDINDLFKFFRNR